MLEETHGKHCLILKEDLSHRQIILKIHKKRSFVAFFLSLADNNLSMKKFVFIFGLILAIVVGAMFIPAKEVEYDYLRLHIRANSNSKVDQNVKYEIKDKMVEFLTPHLCTVESKDKAIKIIESYSNVMKSLCVNLLLEKGFNYSVNIKISNEFFPTRTYSNTTLESGYYDAVIIELGQAEGDNWWCVMYPPLCFVNKNENVKQIKYKSKICEWWKKLFN